MNRRIVGLSAACALLASTGVYQARAEKVPVTQLPDAVQKAIKDQSQGQNLEHVDRETKNGQTVYDAEFQRKGLNRHVVFTADGTVVPGRHVSDLTTSRHPTMALGDLPLPVQKTVKEQQGGRTIADIHKEMKNGQAVYQVEFKDKGANSHIFVASDGSMVVNDSKDSLGERVREKIGLGNDRDTLTLDQTPAAVQKTIRANCDVGSLKPIKREMHDGRAQYDVEYEKEGKNLRLKIDQDGTVVKDNR